MARGTVRAGFKTSPLVLSPPSIPMNAKRRSTAPCPIDAADGGIEHDPAEHLETFDVLAGEPGSIRCRRDVVFEDQRLQSAFLVKDRHFLIVQGTAEDVGCGVDVGIHQAGDRADRRRRGREDAHLAEHLARIEDRRKACGAHDRDAGFEKLAPAGAMASTVSAIGTPEMDRAGRMGTAAAVGEFPSRKIGPDHGTGSWAVKFGARRR